MPRAFSNRASVLTVTCAEYDAMSPAEQRTHIDALFAIWAENYRREYVADLARDDGFVGRDRRSDTGT